MHRIGIRKEQKNEWERRAPLTPDHVAELRAQHGLEFAIQPAPTRVFPDKDYLAAGARLDETLAGCRVVLAIKEIPIEALEAGRTYLFFSHTTKGQPHNMPLLARLLELGATLVDFEHVVDEGGRRLIFFGRYAGHAGMIDALWALGRRFAVEGHVTPFERVRLAHDYSSLDEATHHLHRLGEELRHSGLPEALHPLAVGFTGSGNVTRGAQEIFDRLPYVDIAPRDLPSLVTDSRVPRNVVYRVHFTREDRERGLSPFLPHLTMLVHGAYWRPGHVRVVSLDDLRSLWRRGQARLRVLADISCDVDGGIEATLRATTPGDPVYVYDVERGEAVPGLRGAGPVVLAIDNLPCQLPLEASSHFADTLQRFVPLLAACDWERPFAQLALPRELKDAVIVHRGALAPRYAHLAQHLSAVRG